MPRLDSFFRVSRKVPPPAIMIARHVGYKMEEPEKQIAKNLTSEQHAARLLSELGFTGLEM